MSTSTQFITVFDSICVIAVIGGELFVLNGALDIIESGVARATDGVLILNWDEVLDLDLEA
jgi:hypothetical protein